MTREEQIKKLAEKPVFLQNEIEDCVVRSEPGTGGKYYAKFPGSEEYEISSESNVVIDAVLAFKEISEKEYKEF